jgi:hypothetical protein
MGFRPNRSTINNIVMIRHIYEKCHEYNIEVNNVFVDIMQAFDSVNRSMNPECLKQYKVSRKLINLVQDTLQPTKFKVKFNNDMTAVLNDITNKTSWPTVSTTIYHCDGCYNIKTRGSRQYNYKIKSNLGIC